MSAVLLVAPMPVNLHQMGPAIRYWRFAQALSTEHQVTLLVPNDDHPTDPRFTVCACAEEKLDSLMAAQQVVILQGPALQKHPRLAQILAHGGVEGQHFLVVDLYDPITLEQLAMDLSHEVSRWLNLEYSALLNEQMRLGDFFLCANERQRDYWLGALAALGRVNPATYDGHDARNLIDVVPFGLPAAPPTLAGPVLKGVLPGIAAGDPVILWGGGLWDWLDPLTPIRAMSQVVSRYPRARLLFFESDQHRTAMWRRAKRLAAESGLLGQHVLFADWLSPEQWASSLLEADIGLSFHPASLETHFSFRTRLLDYIWAGLPIVTARGDVMSEKVARHGLGYAVEPGDTGALAAALIGLLDEPDARAARRQAFAQVASHFVWERVVEPLSGYCRQPWHAGDWDRNVARHWPAAEVERLRSEAAHAERRLAEMEAVARHQAERAQAEIDHLAQLVEESDARLQAAMSGRVMRLLIGTQQFWRRVWRADPGLRQTRPRDRK
jgi:hypothetical protein